MQQRLKLYILQFFTSIFSSALFFFFSKWRLSLAFLKPSPKPSDTQEITNPGDHIQPNRANYFFFLAFSKLWIGCAQLTCFQYIWANEVLLVVRCERQWNKYSTQPLKNKIQGNQSTCCILRPSCTNKGMTSITYDHLLKSISSGPKEIKISLTTPKGSCWIRNEIHWHPFFISKRGWSDMDKLRPWRQRSSPNAIHNDWIPLHIDIVFSHHN